MFTPQKRAQVLHDIMPAVAEVARRHRITPTSIGNLICNSQRTIIVKED